MTEEDRESLGSLSDRELLILLHDRMGTVQKLEPRVRKLEDLTKVIAGGYAVLAGLGYMAWDYLKIKIGGAR
jgi:hypothetical protein